MSGILVAPTFASITNLRDVNDAAKADQYSLVWDSGTAKHVYVANVTAAATDASSYGFVVDEDNMASDSATKVPTQQSVKAYVDGLIAGLTYLEAADIDTLAEINAILGDATLVTVEATDASSYGFVVDEDNMASDSATKVPTQQSVKAYVDAAGSSLPVADTTGIAKGSADATKIVRLEVDGLTTSTTRVLTVQDADGTIALTGDNIAASQVTSGTLTHERGGIEADISAVAIGDVLAGTGTGTIGIVAASGASDGDVLTVQADGTVAFETGGGGGGDTLPVADTTGIAKGSVDATKIVRLEVDGLTTATTRVLTVQDADGTIELTGHAHAASDITSGTLTHERGGLETDISAVAIGDVIAGTGTGTLAIVPATGKSDGDVLTIQADGTVDFETPAGGGGGGGGLAVTKKTANYTAVAGDLIVCDSSGGSFTITMPASPTTDDLIGIYLEAGSFTLSVTIYGNGKTLAEFGSTLILHGPGELVTFQYDGVKWVTVGQNGGPLVDNKDHFFGAGDPTKIMRFNLSSVTTATTRTLTVPDASGTVALTNGNTHTGVHDFGGADSLEIPNGAAPTVDAAGEIAVDTTITDYTGMVKYHDGTEELTVLAVPTANLSTTDGEVVSYNAANNELEFIEVVGPYIESTLGGAASGDVIYHDGTSWTNLAKSTDGKILTLENGLPNWADNHGVSTLTDGATVTVDGDKLAVQKVTLAGNRTIAFSNFREGQRVSFKITQDGTGSRTLTWPSSGVTINWAGGAAPTLTATAGKTDWIVIICTDDTGGALVFDAWAEAANV